MPVNVWRAIRLDDDVANAQVAGQPRLDGLLGIEGEGRSGPVIEKSLAWRHGIEGTEDCA